MLRLIDDDRTKTTLHKKMQSLLLETLRESRPCAIPNRGGGEPNPRKKAKVPVVYFQQPGGLFYGPLERATDGCNRTWDAFGFYDPASDEQSNVVQINIPFGTNSIQAAAVFFAKDAENGQVYLMHTGKLSGAGMRKEDVQGYFGPDTVQVHEGHTKLRTGIKAATLDEQIVPQLERFTRKIEEYKKSVRKDA